MIRIIIEAGKQTLNFVKDFFKRIQDDQLMSYANQMTLSLILAFFPFVIFLFSVLGFLNLDVTPILQQLHQMLPRSSYLFAESIILDVFDRQRGTLLALSIFFAIFSSSRCFLAFTKGSNQILKLTDKRNVVIKYLLSIFWVILFVITIVIILFTLVFGQQIIRLLYVYYPVLPLDTLIRILRILIPVVITFIVLTVFYMFVPAQRIRFRQAFPGALFTTLSWTGFTLSFQFYIDSFADYSLFYGALGSMIVLLIWIQLISIIMLMGVTYNKRLIDRKNADRSRFETGQEAIAGNGCLNTAHTESESAD